MAYCEKCGAYVPDGQTKCLACGFDPSERDPYNSGFAYEERSAAQREAQRQAELREKEEERRRRQEEYRRNAEAEYARRQEEQRERERQAESYVNSHPYSDSGRVNRGQMGSRIRSRVSNKVFAALSYLGILFVLPYIFCQEDKFAKFHAKQGLMLFIFDIVAGIIGDLTGIGWALSLFNLYCIYKGMTGALAGTMEELPIIGKFASKAD